MEHGTDFDWQRAIARNFEAIEQIVARLYALAGITSLAPFVATLPRHLRSHILSILRPAEFAARRLIAIAACKLEHRIPPPKTADASAPLRGDAAKARERSDPAKVGKRTVDDSTRNRIPAFALFDPIKPYGDPWLTPDEIAALSDPGYARWFVPPLPPGEPVDARALCLRIAALRHALDDLDGQALRLARWRARRHLRTSRPQRWSPMRPGRPPGWKRRPKTALEEVLAECDFLAHDAWADTS